MSERDPRLTDIRRSVGHGVNDDVDDEVRFHLEGLEEELRRSGLSPDAARDAARARFGDIETTAAAMRALATQRSQSMHRTAWGREFLRDVQYAWRTLRRAPAFSLTALTTLTLGIGAATAIFTVAYAIWLKPLPYGDPDRLVTISDVFHGNQGGVAAAEVADFKTNPALADIAGYNYSAIITTIGDEPVRVIAYWVAPNVFSVLGVHAALGRMFDASDIADGRPLTVVLSDAFWRARYNADPQIIGKQLDRYGTKATIIGVAPRGVQFPQELPSDVWFPLDIGKIALGRSVRYEQAVARLRPGFDVAAANEAMKPIAARLANQYPESNTGWSFSVASLVDETVGAYRSAFALLFGTVGLLLLIVCANIASLSLARHASRRRELTVRAALGASAGRLAMQVAAECVLLAIVGGMSGIVVARFGASALAAMLPSGTPRVSDVGIHLPVIVCASLLAIVTGLLCAVAPALRAAVAPPAAALQSGGRSLTSRHRLQSALVVVEVALSLMLLVSAGAILRRFAELTHRDRGYVPTELLTMHLTMSVASASGPPPAAFFESVLARLRALPGVRNAGAVTGYPGSNMGYLGGGPVSVDPARTEHAVSVGVRSASSSYFATMETPIVAGRAFSDADRDGALHVMIVNRELANRLWRGENPIGKSLMLPASMGEKSPRTVVGVVGDMRLGATASPQIFIPLGQGPAWWADVVVRTQGDPTAYETTIRRAIAAVDRHALVEQVAPMTEILGSFVALEHSQTVIAVALAALATTLAAVGLFGLLTYLVGERRREIGVRLALGATTGNVFGVVLRRGFGLALIGVVIGGAAAKGLIVVLHARVFGLSATAASTFVAAAVLMLLVAVVAAALPARRAMRVDPMTAMR